jgi:hypothetical protein
MPIAPNQWASRTDDSDSSFPVASRPAGLIMTQATRGGVVFSSELAIKLAEMLCEAHYGADDLARQRPLSAVDKDTHWRVEGSWNRNREIDGPGAFFVSIEKYDGRVIDFGEWFCYQPHPSVIPVIQEHLKRKRSDDTTWFGSGIIPMNIRPMSLDAIAFWLTNNDNPMVPFGGLIEAVLETDPTEPEMCPPRPSR